MNSNRMPVRVADRVYGRRLSVKALLLGLAFGLSAIIVAQTLNVGLANANGPHVNAREVFAGQSGPYFVVVTAVPTTGNAHMTVTLSRDSGESPITDAEIQVRGIGPKAGSLMGPVFPIGSLSNPNGYEVNFPIENSGSWIFTVYIDGPLGRTVFDLPLIMEEPGNAEWELIVILVCVFVLATVLILFRRYRNGRRSSFKI